MSKSNKIEFQRNIPSFLARLQSGAACSSDRPDPRLAANRRHAKPRSASEEAADAPVILDENGNVIDDATVNVHGDLQWEHELEDVNAIPKEILAKETSRQGMIEEPKVDGASKPGANNSDKTKKATIGTTRKRKLGRIIGINTDNHETSERDAHRAQRQSIKQLNVKDSDNDVLAKAIMAQGRSIGLAKTSTKGSMDVRKLTEGDGKIDLKKKKKAKKIKLSFDDDD